MTSARGACLKLEDGLHSDALGLGSIFVMAQSIQGMLPRIAILQLSGDIALHAHSQAVRPGQAAEGLLYIDTRACVQSREV